MIFSVIVPFLNEERLIENCLRALLRQTFPRQDYEIIFIDNGSVDGSPDIVARYPVKLLHEARRDPYLARNRGIEAARGPLLAFTDADCINAPDWLTRLHEAFEAQRAHIVLGRLGYPDPTPAALQCYEQYYHTKLDYICRHELKPYYYGHGGNMAVRASVFDQIGRFSPMPIVGDTEIIHRLLRHEPKARIAYAPRARVTHGEVTRFRHCLVKLFECGQYSQTLAAQGSYRTLKLVDKIRIARNCITAHRYGPGRIMTCAGSLLAGQLCFAAGGAMGTLQGMHQDGARYLFGTVRRLFREWRWAVTHRHKTFSNPVPPDARMAISAPTRTLILVYNGMFGAPLALDGIPLPPGCAITTNRRYRREAAAVVFHIPTLRRRNVVRSYPEQLQVAWFMESAAQYPILADSRFMDHFDLTMSFRRDADIWTPYTFPDVDRLLEVTPKSKDKLVAFFFSYPGELSGRNRYVMEFMKYLDAHSYGRFMRNRPLPEDRGRSTKLQVLSEYKFNLAYENTMERDYVTEKFFDPLEAGCVPVYMGAPNVDAFAPGDHCYINATDFDGPKDLAAYLLALNEDDDAYDAYFAWRRRPPRTQYSRFLEEQRTEPFVRLCALVQRRQETPGSNIE